MFDTYMSENRPLIQGNAMHSFHGEGGEEDNRPYKKERRAHAASGGEPSVHQNFISGRAKGKRWKLAAKQGHRTTTSVQHAQQQHAKCAI